MNIMSLICRQLSSVNRLLAILVTALLSFPASVSAAVVTITVSGIVDTYAEGNLKLFGIEAAKLNGDTITEVFTFNLDKGTVANAGGNYSIQGSGAMEGSALVTVGGHPLTIDGTRQSYLGYTVGPVGYQSNAINDGVDIVSETDNGSLFDYAGVNISTTASKILANGGLAQSGSYTLTPADNAFVYVVGEQDCGQPNCRMDQIGGAIDGITFAIGAPEPASWALMIIGVAGIGVVARHRRKPTTQVGFVG